MSTKTITKRIALATTVALGAGVLSLVSVTSAHASGEGLISINANSNTVPSATASQGLLPGSSVSTALAGTALILANGQISVTAAAAATGKTTVLVVSGGTITAAAPGATAGVLSSDLSTYGVVAANGTASILVKPNSSAPFTIYSYTGGTSTSSATGGTLTAVVVVSVTGSSTVGTVSVTNSGIFYAGTGGAVAGSAAPSSPADSTAAGIGSSTYAQYQSAMIVARDAYKQYLPANTLIQATATNGAILTFGDAATSATTQRTSAAAPGVPAVSSAYVVTGFADQVALLVSAPALAPVSTVVTVTANGVVIGTKAFTFTGKVAKVSLSAPTNGYQPSTGGSITVAFADAAGNAVYPVSGLAKNSDGTKGAGISTSTVTYPTASAAGSFLFTCGSINSTGQVTMDFTNTGDASVVTSNAVPVTCSGSADSYTAALDKTSYNVGDLAVLTVTFKDAAGQLAADVTGAIANASNTPSIFGANLTNTTGTSTTAGTTADTTTNGVATYKFIVGATAGASRLYVDFPKVDLLNGKSQTIAYTINSAGGTSLNDVLKGIVSLIASINKQIAALAKLVTKKK
jgi:hypothetical protein